MFVLTALLYVQYEYNKKNLINAYLNKKTSEVIQIKSRFKTIFDNAELVFKSKIEENLKKLYTLYLLYNNLQSFNPQKLAEILNKDEKKGHYEVFLIDRNYTIIKASYKPDIGYNIGQFPVFRKILDKVFRGKEKIDISPVYIDPASMNLKRYFLIRSPDKKYLLEIAYVIDIYPQIKKTYFKIKDKIHDLENLKLYFVSKYLIYPIKFYGKLSKTPLNVLAQNTVDIYKEILKIKGTDHIYINKNFYENVALKIFKLFEENNEIIEKLDLQNQQLSIYIIIGSFFKDINNKLIIKSVFNTYTLDKDLESLRNRFIIIVVFVILIFLFIRFVIFYIRKTLQDLIIHMNDNTKIEKKASFIKEIDVLINEFNKYRDRLNKEIEKNKQLLMENKRFVIDTVHQIKTPLSIITLNSDYIRLKTDDKDVLEALDEIDAAITILTTSYEDLSYLASSKVVEYKPALLNVSEVLKDRIKFFSILAKAKGKSLITFIDEGVKYNINKVEMERIIDNNISNAIEYSKGKDIIIELKKENGSFVLRFISFGDKIKNPQKIFEKNYREHSHKRGLGIGLNIVKNICDKYCSEYKAYYLDGKNIFEYKFKY